MFLGPARSELEEHLSYERFVLNRCNSLLRGSEGFGELVELTFDDSFARQLHMDVQMTLGGGGVAAFIEQLSPLLFTTSFKLIDMVVEWIITENGITCPWKFWQKKQIINNQQLTYPDFLDTDAHLRSVVLGFFNRLSEHRNAIVHGSWGQIVNGDLSFDFIVKYTQQHVQETIPFQTVLNMASLCSTVGDLLVEFETSNATSN